MNLLGLLSAVSLNSTRLGNMSISINLNIEPIAILISIISLAFVYFDYQRNKRDFRLNNAPLLIVEDETLEMNKERYFEKKFEPELLHKKFILDRRCVIEKVVHFSEITSEASVIPEKKSYVSIILDLTENSKFVDAEKKIGYCILNMKNVGYPLISFEVKLITIHFKEKDDLVLNPGKHNRLTEYIGKNESLDILVSAVYDVDSNYSLFDEEQIKKGEFTKQKLAETKGKIMNIYLADNANRFDNITITAVTTNIYNYTYHQKIELKETDGVIHTTTILEGEKFIE